MDNKKHFSKDEEAILKVLYEEQRFMSVEEIAKESGLSWQTVKKSLFKLRDKGIVKKQDGN